jgi:hypothetical protein
MENVKESKGECVSSQSNHRNLFLELRVTGQAPAFRVLCGLSTPSAPSQSVVTHCTVRSVSCAAAVERAIQERTFCPPNIQYKS